MRVIARLGRLCAALFRLAVLAGLVAAVPYGLVTQIGWPLPRTFPDAPEQVVPKLQEWLTTPVTDQVVLNLLAVAMWILWGSFTATVIVELPARLWGVVPRRVPVLAPMQSLAGWLLSGVTVGVLATGTLGLSATAPAGEHAAPALTLVVPEADPPGGSPTSGTLAESGTGSTRSLDTTSHPTAGHRPYQAPEQLVHEVARGDWMWHIAGRYLGDERRYPEIAALNPDLDAKYEDYPDHIQPEDKLILPEDARDRGERPHATGEIHQPPVQPAPPRAEPAPLPSAPQPPVQPAPEPTGPAAPPPASPGSSGDPDGVVEPPAVTATPAQPSVTAEPRPTPASPSATASASDQQEPPPGYDLEHPDNGGVTLPGGSFVPWTLAAAITAAAAWVFLQRRRRNLPTAAAEHDREQAPEFPPPVAELQRQVARHQGADAPVDLAERAAAVPDLPSLPEGGVGLVGDGAHPATRAALVAALASGGPRDPDRRGEVVIDGATLSTLIGADAARLGPWPRLHIADDLDHALTIVEARLLHRSRILDDHSLTDLDTLRDRAPDEEPLPPVLLIAETPPPGARMRARVSLGLGTGLDVSALLLGAWDHGTTLQVAADGHTSLLSGPPVDTIGQRMAVLDTATATQILATLREAHTGEPPAITVPAPQPAEQPPDPTIATPRAEPDPPAGPAPAAEGDGQPKVSLRVLGSPRVEDIRLPGRPPRAKALELAVYLACHPNGAPTRELGEYLNPDARVREADQRVHTNASNLRHVLGRAGGPRKNAYLVKTGGRYRLDPTNVEVDLWRLRELLTQATVATADERRRLALQACQLYTAPLADGCDYEWVEPYREKTRRWSTQAHLLAAGELLDTDPQHAAELLDKAIALDPYNEQLYRTAMHARHALGDGDAIRTLLRTLTKALGDLDAEPTEDTIDLAGKLRASLDQR